MSTSTEQERTTARGLVAAVEEALAEAQQSPTSHRDGSPLPRYGDTPPVPQPGRPPMSQKATDLSGLMLAGGVASLPVGGSLALVLYAVGQADPVSLAIAGGAPVALVLAVSWLLRSAGRARRDAYTEHHHHYTGPVHQDQRASSTRGVWAKTNN
ncbi:hypothetical protein [Streptomyces reniochalinae]|uniref:Uncharacterized protein n=1 Tax=Streptomyces reniochalinae TaxID=2250578 RepID=A0A367EW08_9ACTN|nr:hypothetical protein [Streptomyces reniochalinae]RCG21765.1 hypothetical protein DQ392_08640 [Streptomyces reniochalinae]